MYLIVDAVPGYGATRAYPACERSRMLATIARTKTLPIRILREAEAGGAQIRVRSFGAMLRLPWRSVITQ